MYEKSIFGQLTKFEYVGKASILNEICSNENKKKRTFINIMIIKTYRSSITMDWISEKLTTTD